MAFPRKINHEETKDTKIFTVFLRALRFFVVDFHCLGEVLRNPVNPV